MVRFVHIAGMATLLVVPLLPSQTETRDEHERMRASELYMRAQAAGGNVSTLRKVDPAKLYPSLSQLVKASEQVLLVHINRNWGQLSPSGTDPTTMYEATLIQSLKGPPPDRTVLFSVPAGTVAFGPHSHATVNVQGFLPAQNGKRYLLCLRFAQGAEKQITPGLRLTGGDGVQGAFVLEDEQARANFGDDPIAPQYYHRPVSAFLNEVQGLAGGRPEPDFTNQRPEPDCHPSSYCFLNAKMFQGVGLHLPSYLPAVLSQAAFQRYVTRVQKLTVYWDSMPGQPDEIIRPDMSASPPPSGNFLLKNQIRNISGPAPSGEVGLQTGSGLIAVGITSSSQIRSIWNSGQDMRISGAEGGAISSIWSRVTFDIYIPDDPEIKTLVFLMPVHNNVSGWNLERIGSLDLTAN